MEISFTRFRVYRECPWKYRLTFVEGRQIPLDPPSSLGITLHRAIERFHRGGEPSWEALADAYEAEFLRTGYPDSATRAQWSQKGLRILRRYHEQETSRRTEIVGVEREFIFPLGRHTVRGMVDRIDRHPDGTYEVIDYKTRFGLDAGDAAPPPDSDLQLKFYALGARESLSIPVSLLTVHYLAAGKRQTAPYDASGEAALKIEIERVADAIEAKRFDADTSFCPRCAFRLSCQYSSVN
jgi:RecB family exonuclease